MIIEKDKGGVISQLSFSIPNILKIQEAAIKDPTLRILPKYNAQGNRHQWILPTGSNEVWHQLGSASANLRQQVAERIAEAKHAFGAIQKGADSNQIDAIFNTPDNDEFVYYRTDFDGTLSGVEIAGWGFRYPDNTQKKGVVIADETGNIQKVEVCFMGEGKGVANREFRYGLPSNMKTKMAITDRNGRCSIGNFTIGLEFFVSDVATSKRFIFTVTKGQETYVCDVTVEKPVEVPKKPEPPTVITGGNTDKEKDNNDVEDMESETDYNDAKSNIHATIPEIPDDVIVKPEETKKELSVRILITDQKGKPVPDYPVFIAHDGRKERLTSDIGGYIRLKEMKERDVISVTDGFSDSNRQDYTASVENDTYVYQLDYFLKTGNRDITIHIVDDKGRPVLKDYAVLCQNNKILQCTPDEMGRIYLDDSDFQRNQPIKFILGQAGKEISTEDFVLIPEEQEYTVEIDIVATPLWKRVLEAVAAIVGVAVILWVFGIITVICDHLS